MSLHPSFLSVWSGPSPLFFYHFCFLVWWASNLRNGENPKCHFKLKSLQLLGVSSANALIEEPCEQDSGSLPGSPSLWSLVGREGCEPSKPSVLPSEACTGCLPACFYKSAFPYCASFFRPDWISGREICLTASAICICCRRSTALCYFSSKVRNWGISSAIRALVLMHNFREDGWLPWSEIDSWPRI